MSTFQGIGKSLYEAISAKTASYSIVPADHGKLFTNRGAAGAVTFTLPVTADVSAGWWCDFMVVADQSFVVAAGTPDTLIALNDALADSVTINTAARRIGNGLRCIHDGTGWLVQMHPAISTIATAGIGDFTIAT